MLYEDYRKYFLKQTNSELGLRYAIYESLFVRNSHFTIAEVDPEREDCPKCLALPKPTTTNFNEKKAKDSKKKRQYKGTQQVVTTNYFGWSRPATYFFDFWVRKLKVVVAKTSIFVRMLSVKLPLQPVSILFKGLVDTSAGYENYSLTLLLIKAKNKNLLYVVCNL